MLAVTVSSTTWAYVALFLLVVAGGAGVPAIGTAAVGTAAVLASQHVLDIDTVIAVACVAAVLGGVLGYAGGRRWGARLMDRPGPHQQQRERVVAKGHELYRRWGWLACFVIPSFVAGIARMLFAMFLIFNTIAAVGYQFATALPAYGAGKIVSGNGDVPSVLYVLFGLIVLTFIGLRLRRRRRKRLARAARESVAATGVHARGAGDERRDAPAAQRSKQLR
jgi:membrane protein DedA with SNARE-associated domain